MTPEQQNLIKLHLPNWEYLTPDEVATLCASMLTYLSLRLQPEYEDGLTKKESIVLMGNPIKEAGESGVDDGKSHTCWRCRVCQGTWREPSETAATQTQCPYCKELGIYPIAGVPEAGECL